MNKPRHYGPYIDYSVDRQILALRETELTFREIAEKLKLDVKSVYRRYKRAVADKKKKLLLSKKAINRAVK